jgi:hypothetical protein
MMNSSQDVANSKHFDSGNNKRLFSMADDLKGNSLKINLTSNKGNRIGLDITENDRHSFKNGPVV